MTHIHLLFATDAGFLNPTALALWSALRHIPTERQVVAHIVTLGLSEAETRAAFDFCLIRPFTLVVHRSEALGLVTPGQYDESITTPVFYRLFMHEFLDVDRVLYIDGDTYSRGDVSELYDCDLNGKVFGAVRDIFAVRIQLMIDGVLPMPAGEVDRERTHAMYENLKRVSGSGQLRDVVNTGILIVDLPKWRDREIGQKAIELCFSGGYLIGDQDALNVAARGQIEFVSSAWNSSRGNSQLTEAFPEKDYQYFATGRDDPKIIHFPGPQKPWKNIARDYRSAAFEWELEYSQIVQDSGISWPDAHLVSPGQIEAYEAFGNLRGKSPSNSEFVKSGSALAGSFLDVSNKNASGRGNEDQISHRYAFIYDLMFHRIRTVPISIALFAGDKPDVKACAADWLDYFPRSEVTVFGSNLADEPEDDRLVTVSVPKSKPQELVEAIQSQGPFDIVVDLGRTSSWEQQSVLKQVFPIVQEGGAYILEGLHKFTPPWQEVEQCIRTSDLLRLIFERGGYAGDATLSREEAEYLRSCASAFAVIPSLGTFEWGHSKLAVLTRTGYAM
jgi:lipopolysaccharide biosynthesis glycosyltransferase